MGKRLAREVDGNNQMGSLEAYIKRTLYDTFAYRENGGMGPIGVVDFQFGEKMMYGRISKTGVPIVYADRGTRHVASGRGKTVEMVSFVADAFEAMIKKIKRDIRMGVVPNNPLLSSIAPKSSYVPVSRVYSNYSDSLYDAYVAYIKKYNLTKKLTGIDEHYVIYQEFLNHIMDLGFNTTMSGYVRSKRANPAISGLFVDLELFDFSNDDGKTDFIDLDFFEYYVNVAKKHGFSVAKHIPTRLVADIDSPHMLKYTVRYNASSADQLLQRYYRPAYTDGYKKFKKDMINFYNRYAKESPWVSSKRRTQRKLIHVQRQLDNKGEEFFLRIYIEMRNREEGQLLARAEKEYLKKRCTDLFKVRGIERALEYAEKEFSRLPMEANTVTSIRKRLKNA